MFLRLMGTSSIFRFFLAPFLILASFSIKAQSDSLVRNHPLDSIAEIHTPSKTLFHIGEGLAYGGVTYLVYKNWDDDIKFFAQRNRSSTSNFISKNVGTLGLGKSQAILWAGTTAAAFILKDTRLKQLVTIWAGSLLLNSEITDQLKKTFHRHRPATTDSPKEFDWRKGKSSENISLPSAHTSNIFTTATVFASLYKDKKWVGPLAYGVATLVGLSRIHDNAHWASDVMAGAAIGFLAAKCSIRFYRWTASKLHFLPYFSPGTKEVSVSIAIN
jgi:membrane-associated phospholipid phosphatase